ncbi:hypothetical protein [uncultured Oxalicibacterium sp.]|uniref:hypothetical protein n=1 Tax=uncultured Oxalicibacterium sp. TaxID=1168540 RepID=UPI0025D4C753|nr:hypothetical protein [uncultured Oxalicibacterium sp.]
MTADISAIVCLPDLLQTSYNPSRNLFDLVREPIRQACALDIAYAPGNRRVHAALADFDLQHFQYLSKQGKDLSPDHLWQATYHDLPSAAIDYLFSHVSDNTLLLTCDISPWLRQACQARKIHFLDIRYSPLRFGRDLYIALRTSNELLAERIANFAVSEEELRLEAAFLGANVRAHRARLAEMHRHQFDLDGALIYIRQEPHDIALLGKDGHFQQAEDHVEKMQMLAAGRKLLFTVDYPIGYAGSTAQQERLALSERLGLPVEACLQSTYQILSAEEDLEVCGISSSILQEAVWFDKKAHCFGKPFTPLISNKECDQDSYLQVHYQEILAPAFWHQVLQPDTPAPRLSRLPALDRHHGREMFEEWGDYEKVLHWERSLPWHAYERSGGILQRRRVDALEKMLASNSPQAPVLSDTNNSDMRSRIRQLKDSKCGETAYILGNAPSLMTLDINELMQRESFWCNKSFKLKDQGFNYRPKYYFLLEPIGFQQWQQDIIKIEADIKFVGTELYSYIEKTQAELLTQQTFIALTEASRRTGNLMFEDEKNFSYDPSICVYDGCTVLLMAVQMAFYMGYSKVLIGGVDLDYSQPYFYGETNSLRRVEHDPITGYMRQSFLVAKKHFEKNGRILAKITSSPHLPLDYMHDPAVQR